MQRYNFLTLNGKKLIEDGLSEFEEYEYNITTAEKSLKPIYSLSENRLNVITYSKEPRENNAMLYQLETCVKKDLGADSILGEDSLCRYLIYVDFKIDSKNINFGNSKNIKDYWKLKDKKDWKIKPSKVKDEECINVTQAKLYWLFRDGFTVKYEGGEEIRYLPFDKSASMSRQEEITFISENIRDEMNERVTLGFGWDGKRRNISGGNVIDLNESMYANLSKYYAYRGLMFSNGKRIEQTEEFVLNEKTVIVIPDIKGYLEDHQFYTVEKGSYKRIEGIYRAKDHKSEKDAGKETFFDGEGIISPEYAQLINKGLHNKRELAYSFQIRLPFTKGMLHTVDFKGFIREFFTDKYNIDLDSLYICDLFGKYRKIAEAEIILTQSMFKASKWMTWIKEKVRKTIENYDVMHDYFDRVSFYHHALYIGNTDLNYIRRNPLTSNRITKVQLTYQFINTLDLSSDREEKDVLTTLIDDKYADNITALSGNRTEKYRRLLRAEEDPETADDAQISESMTPWQYALSQNPAFLNDQKIKDELKGITYSLIKNIGYGKFEVEGVHLFISHDLLYFMKHIVKNLVEFIDNKKVGLEVAKNDFRKALNHKTLPYDTFYVPYDKKNNVLNTETDESTYTIRKYFAIFRNPHLSRNEQCLLKAKRINTNKIEPSDKEIFSDYIYNKYFGQLKAVMMLPVGSVAANALGGADFDGDIVKLVSEPIIVEAVKKGAYKEVKEVIKEGNVEKAITKYKRTLPVISIPSFGNDKSASVNADGSFDEYFSILCDTFSNCIGIFANNAIASGKKQYLQKEKPAVKSEDQSILNDTRCEDYTILTGLEIDAAKTGEHPPMPESKDKTSSSYIENKKVLDTISSLYKYKVTENKDGKELSLNPYKGKELLNFETDDYDTLSYPERLIYHMLKVLKANEDFHVSGDTGSKNNPCFKFEDADKNWKKNLDKKKSESLAEIFGAYKAVCDISGKSYKKHHTVNISLFAGKALTLLKLQYGDLSTRISVDGEECSVSDAFDDARGYLSFFVTDESKAEAAIKKLKNNEWQFTGGFLSGTERKKERIKFVRDTLEIETYSPWVKEYFEMPKKKALELFTNFDICGFYLFYYLP